MQHRSGYRSPDAAYEGQLLELAGPGTRWLDLGCGRSPCPFNPRLADALAGSCAELVGVDASANVWANPYLHARVQSDLAAYRPDRSFDLVTMRMVAEHVAAPAAVARALARLVRPGGALLIYTVHRWSPTAILGRLAPHRAHVAAMRIMFGGESRDVFPAHYRMNTPAKLRGLLEPAGFRVERLEQPDDCRATQRWRMAHRLELATWRVFRRCRVPYPERCIVMRLRRVR